MRPAFIERRASGGDAGCLGALATRVFLDTNATAGTTRELANEARSVYSPQVFAARLQDAAVEIVVAQSGEAIVGFIDDVGVTQYVIEGTAHENRVLARRIAG